MDKTIFNLRLIFLFWPLVAVLLLVLFETEILMPGIWAGTGMTETFFFLQTMMMILTLCAIPVALKLLNWPWVRKQIVREGADSSKAYLRWSAVRCGILGVSLLLNLAVYYCALENANALCALILLFSYFFCWPSEVKMKAETDIVE